MVTPFYAAIFGFIYIFLSIRIIKNRRAQNIAIGDGGDNVLTKAIRVHGNFAEYVPFTLILLFFFETQIQSSLFTHFFGVSLIISRLIHAYGVSQIDENIRLRVISMITTFAIIMSLSTAILLSYLLQISF